MVNWYYVHGSDRVGPVSVEALKNLFLKEEINRESYVWRKGFQNWERLKDVTELNFNAPEDIHVPKVERRSDKVVVNVNENIIEEESSPEINFNFDWARVRDEEELFFVKIQHDIKIQIDSDLFGPYSLNELRDAIKDRRLNNESLLFAAGMPGWIKIGDTPLNPKNLKLNTSNILDEAPLLVVVNNDPLPLVTMVQEAGIKKCTLLGAGSFQTGKTVMCSMYSGKTLKATNLKLLIDEYRPHEQKVLCSVISLSESAKKIMQNYAD